MFFLGFGKVFMAVFEEGSLAGMPDAINSDFQLQVFEGLV